MNPFIYARPANAQEAGFNHSHTIPELKAALGARETLLKVDLAEIMPGGFQGLATVEVTCEDVTLTQFTEIDVVNAVLMLEVSWSDGIGGGIEYLDATRGQVFTCGGFTALNVVAFWATSDGSTDPTTFKAYASKKIECTVHWYTSANPKHARMTSPQVTLDGANPSAWIPIPRWARDMIAQTDTVAANATLVAEFSAANGLAGVNSVKFRTQDPTSKGTAIGAGVEFVRFTNTVACKVIAFWDQWN